MEAAGLVHLAERLSLACSHRCCTAQEGSRLEQTTLAQAVLVQAEDLAKPGAATNARVEAPLVVLAQTKCRAGEQGHPPLGEAVAAAVEELP